MYLYPHSIVGQFLGLVRNAPFIVWILSTIRAGPFIVVSTVRLLDGRLYSGFAAALAGGLLVWLGLWFV